MLGRSFEFTIRTNNEFNSFTDFNHETIRQIEIIVEQIKDKIILTTDFVDIRTHAITIEQPYKNYYSAIIVVYNYDASKKVSISDAKTIRNAFLKNTMWNIPEENSEIRESSMYK